MDIRPDTAVRCGLKSRLPPDDFHARVGALWRIRKGDWTV